MQSALINTIPVSQFESSALISTSDSARIETLGALVQLYQRLSTARSIPYGVTTVTPRVSTFRKLLTGLSHPKAGASVLQPKYSEPRSYGRETAITESSTPLNSHSRCIGVSRNWNARNSQLKFVLPAMNRPTFVLAKFPELNDGGLCGHCDRNFDPTTVHEGHLHYIIGAKLFFNSHCAEPNQFICIWGCPGRAYMSQSELIRHAIRQHDAQDECIIAFAKDTNSSLTLMQAVTLTSDAVVG
jgi:hypothetical protein